MYKISIEAARVNAKMSKKDAADMLKVSVSTISNWENKISHPTAEQFLMLCKVYQCPIDMMSVLR